MINGERVVPGSYQAVEGSRVEPAAASEMTPIEAPNTDGEPEPARGTRPEIDTPNSTGNTQPDEFRLST